MDALTAAVHVLSPESAPELQEAMGRLEAEVIARGARLVVVDSIAALLRAEYGRERLTERQALLGQQAATLKAIAVRRRRRGRAAAARCGDHPARRPRRRRRDCASRSW